MLPTVRYSISVNTIKEHHPSVMKCVGKTYKITPVHITACVILQKRDWWNFVPNLKFYLVRLKSLKAITFLSSYTHYLVITQSQKDDCTAPSLGSFSVTSVAFFFLNIPLLFDFLKGASQFQNKLILCFFSFIHSTFRFINDVC